MLMDTMTDILCTHAGISELLSLMLNWLSVTLVEIHGKDYQNLGQSDTTQSCNSRECSQAIQNTHCFFYRYPDHRRCHGGTQGDGAFLCDEATVLGAAIKERSSISVGLRSISYGPAAVPFVTMTNEMF